MIGLVTMTLSYEVKRSLKEYMLQSRGRLRNLSHFYCYKAR